jgi:PAS domain S-box-containing protein
VKRLAILYAFAVEHCWTDKALIESEEEYRKLANSLPQVVFETDEKGTLTFVNRNAFNFFGYTEKDVNKGLNALQMITPSDRNRAMENILRVLRGEKLGGNEYTALRKDGSTFPIAVHANPIVHEDRATGLRGIIIDLSEHKLAEEELDREKEKFRLLVEKSPLGVCLIGKGAQYKYINPKFIEMFGYTLEDIPTGHEWFKKAFPDPEYRKQVISAWLRDLAESKANESHPRTFTVRCKDGTEKVVYFLSVTMSRGDQFILAQDITEQTRLEGQLRQAQKMEAIGTLAGGIAHDFNNILSAIMGYTELSKFEALDGSPIMDKLNEILKASHRARDMVRQILAFSRQNPQGHLPIQISPIVKEALKMLRGSLPATIEIRQHMDNGTGIVEADATQIHQVLMNLSTNAAHAMNEKGGILDISVTDVDVNRVEAARHADLSQGPYVRLTVSDTGQGISKEVMERIFEPYFTTKEKGVGTGLGLAVTHGIVKSHGGAITLESKPGKGSTFNVYIPRIEKEVTPEHETTEIFPAGRERILFIDDEKVLVEVGKQMLEKLGHEVTTRTSSIEALELFRVKPDQFDLVITDMTMPNMTGDKLAKEIMGIRADIPIVLCTGYSERIGRESAEKMGIRGFVMKPLSMNELANAIRNGIDKRLIQ